MMQWDKRYVIQRNVNSLQTGTSKLWLLKASVGWRQLVLYYSLCWIVWFVHVFVYCHLWPGQGWGSPFTCHKYFKVACQLNCILLLYKPWERRRGRKTHVRREHCRQESTWIGCFPKCFKNGAVSTSRDHIVVIVMWWSRDNKSKRMGREWLCFV